MSDKKTEFLIRGDRGDRGDRLGWMLFLGLELVSASRQRMKEDARKAVKEGSETKDIWPDEASKAAQKDIDARWTVKCRKGRRGHQDIAIPVYGYKSHIAIDRRYRFVRTGAVTNAARHDGGLLSEVMTRNNTSNEVRADSACRSKANEDFLRQNGLLSRIHRKKPGGTPMPTHIARGNTTRSRMRSCIEHVFAEQKHRMELAICTIGIKRAEAKIMLANIACNMKRLVFLERNRAMG